MDHFDDIQVEELENYDFCCEDDLFDDDKDNKTFNSFLNSNTDYWLWRQVHLTLVVMLLPC